MMENRTMLGPDDLDGFDKRKLPSPGFQVEIVILDHDASMNTRVARESPATSIPSAKSDTPLASSAPSGDPSHATEGGKPGAEEKDDVFSDTESEGSVRKGVNHGSEKISSSQAVREGGLPQRENEQHTAAVNSSSGVSGLSNVAERSRATDASYSRDSVGTTDKQTKEEVSVQSSRGEAHDENVNQTSSHLPPSDFKAIAAASAADASVFTFGDEEDYESGDD